MRYALHICSQISNKMVSISILLLTLRAIATSQGPTLLLAQFALTARDETDLDALTGGLVRVVQETLQPEGVSVWLRKK